jgi:hypothetical protein
MHPAIGIECWCGGSRAAILIERDAKGQPAQNTAFEASAAGLIDLAKRGASPSGASIPVCEETFINTRTRQVDRFQWTEIGD